MEESRRGRARRLGRLSWQVLQEDRRLLVFPLVSAVTNMVIGAIAFGLAAGLEGTSHSHWRAVFVIAGAVVSFPVTFVAFYSGVALATVLARKLDGVPLTSADGLAGRAGACRDHRRMDAARVHGRCDPAAG